MGLREKKEILTRERIIQEAFKLFSKEGIEAANMADISKQSDISRPTLYKYFVSKANLVDAVYIWNLDKMRLPRLQIEELSIREMLIEIMQFFDRLLLQQPEVLVFDSQYNLYSALKHRDPTKFPNHLVNSPQFSEFTDLLLLKLNNVKINIGNDKEKNYSLIFLPYLEHVQRLAIFSIQRRNEDREQLTEELDAFKEIFLEWLFH